MPEIGCKTCGRRKKRDLVNEVNIIEPSVPSQPSYVIKTESKIEYLNFDWKSMSKMV